MTVAIYFSVAHLFFWAAGLERLGARQLVGLLRNVLLETAGDAHLAPLTHGRILAEACTELCWEKIHTGNWREVRTAGRQSTERRADEGFIYNGTMALQAVGARGTYSTICAADK